MRKIIHVDMDCYFAAIEMRDDPSLRHIPIAIGGSEDRRGVISTCNYPTRKFGVRSAMATAYAKKLCPQLTLLPGRMNYYREVSQQIMAIFRRYSDCIEPLSLDEAFLDVSDSHHCEGSATLIAQRIRQDIANELQLTASAGVAPNKFLAKIASEQNKPDGLFVITPEQVAEFVATLPLRAIPGIGPATEERLAQAGLHSCQDVYALSEAELIQRFGRLGALLHQRAYGIDNRPVQHTRERKSVGVEHTLAQDIYDFAACWQVLEQLVPQLQQRLKQREIHKVQVKLKFSDFNQTTVERSADDISPMLLAWLLDEALARAAGRGIRLVGISTALSHRQQQLSLALQMP